ncbi:MAG: PqqD family peptide modification chaperone [Kofleriaceae bacterium]|nr:PqqD family peptide modification chaperone [Kofleriaceae bacterium]
MNIYRKNPLSAGRVVDGLAFVVTAEDNKLHTLNVTGTELWRLAQSSEGVSIDSGASKLVELFKVELSLAKEDVAECLQAYASSGILIEE